jgi:hypothetical protein
MTVNRICVTAVVLATMLIAPAVGYAAPPVNDNFDSGYLFNSPGEPLTDVTFDDPETNIDATLETNEPTDCIPSYGGPVTLGRSVWYAFYPDLTGQVTVAVVAYQSGGGPQFYPVEAIYPDGRCDTADGFGRTVVSEYVAGGSGEFNVQVGGQSGGQGNFAIALHFDPDTDADGLLDNLGDECVRAAGSDALHGCPDADGDGIPDQKDGAANPDKCLGEKGSPGRTDGCLDSDVDGFINRADRCPSQAGGLGGCPDSDGDGIADPDDKCPAENARARDANKNGCLDYVLLNPTVKLTFDRTGKGIKVTLLQVKDVPAGTRVSVSCSRRACSSQTKTASLDSPIARASNNVSLPKLKKKLRAGVKIFIRVTKPGAVGKYYVVTIKKGRYKASRPLCLAPGSKKPSSKCNTAR